MNNTEPLRTAVVGLRIHAGGLEPDGNHGLIKSFHAQEDADVVAYCEWDPDEEAALASLAQYDPKARIFTDLGELLAWGEFDAAVVMLSPDEATGATIRLAEAGKHMFIEKQAARTAPEVTAALRAGARAQPSSSGRVSLAASSGGAGDPPLPGRGRAREAAGDGGEAGDGSGWTGFARARPLDVPSRDRRGRHFTHGGRALADALPTVCASAGCAL